MVCLPISQRINCLHLRLPLERSGVSEPSQGMFVIAKAVMDLFCQFRSFLSYFFHILISSASFSRFETIEAAERCIISLRRYRNLHPTFSKVCCALVVLNYVLILRCSKSIRFPVLPMHRVPFRLHPHLPGTSRVPPAVVLLMDLLQAHWLQMPRSKRRWKVYMIR